MSYEEQSERAGRHIMPDLVRAFAVLGIVLVNVAYFAYPGEVTYHDGGLKTGLDSASYFGVNAFFLFKSYTLFSFMFGAGLAYQMLSAQKRGLPFGRRYFRRLIGLILLGVAHVSFAFIGDILIVYAVLGALLFLFRNKSVKSLMRWGIALIILQIILSTLFAAMFYAGETFSPKEMSEAMAEMRAAFPAYYEAYTHGSFTDTITQRWQDWVGYIGFAAPIQAPGVLGFFLFGLAAVKSGVIADPKAALWQKSRRIYFPIGILISLAAAYVMYAAHDPMSGKGMMGSTLILIGSPLATLGYLGWIAKWADGPNTRIKTFFARGGTATLSAYLLQSLILSWVFNGYGLGLYGQLGATACIAIGLVTGIATLIFVSLWRKKFKRGPFEVLLRSFTYWGDNR